MKKNIIFFSALFIIIGIITLYSRVIKVSKSGNDTDTDTTGYVYIYDGNVEEKMLYKMNETVNVHLMDKRNLKEDNFDIYVTDAKLSNELSDEYKGIPDVENMISRAYSNDAGFAFKDELRYIYVDYSLENKCNNNIIFNMDDMRLYNFDENLNYIVCSMNGCLFINDDKNDVYGFCAKSNFILKSKEKVNIKAVYVIMPNTIYDVYLSYTCPDSPYYESKFISLNIATYETGYGTFYKGQGPYDSDKRDGKRAKIRNKVINYDFFNEQKGSSFFLDRYFCDYDAVVGEPYEQAENDKIPGMELDVLESALYDDIEELPDNFQKYNYVADMTKLNSEKLSYPEKDFRYLYVKVKMRELGNMGNMEEYVAQYMWIYNRDSEGKLWYIGYPDDYYILSSTNKEHYIGNYEIVRAKENDEIVVEAVYVIVPDTVYDIYIFNNMGMIYEEYFKYYGDPDFFARYYGISLKMKLMENGGIK